MDSKIDYDLIGFIVASYYRSQVLEILGNSTKMPCEISKELYKRNSQVSTALKELKEKNLVECINEEATKGRLYKATSTGKEILKLKKEL